MVRHLLTLNDLTDKELLEILDFADEIKGNPKQYATAMKDQTLLMIFAKPSLRTRLSFEVGMTQMDGHGIYYDLSNSPMGKKESIADTARTAARYVDIVMARLFGHEDIEEYAKYSKVPVINALTNFAHPCQIIADLQTIREKKGGKQKKLKGIKLAYCGDGNNNVTHSLIEGCTKVGMDISVACPKGTEFEPQAKVIEIGGKSAERNKCKLVITNEPHEAVKDADVIYTDSWMSYHVPKEKEAGRMTMFKSYQVNSELMKHAKKDAIFMNCLPAMRGYEQTVDVIDGPQSVVFDQAENRLHAQKAIMLFLLGRMGAKG
ncbi:TPA: ornithine carbamoyltransferase [Candidatus Micrarchaeota archaeon]|nr:ornithine carbamoyltransferase [Candidatus Micrarchaeota archaeon]